MFPFVVEAWRSLVQENARGLPVEFLLAWVKNESGGNPAALGAVTEVGLFQIDMQDGPAFGGNVQTLHRNFAPTSGTTATRALTASEKLLQVTTGVAMVTAYRDASRTKLAALGADWTEGASDFWNLVKLHHGLPSIARDLLPAFGAVHGRPPSSWSEWASWVNGLTYAETAALSAASARYYYPGGAKGQGPHKALARFTENAEVTGQYGGVELLGRFADIGVLVAIFVAMFFLTR